MGKGIRISEKHGVNPMLVQCPLCAQETGEIALLGKLPDDAEAPRRAVIPGSPPCEKCQKHMAMGFLLIECADDSDPKNPARTGNFWVIDPKALKADSFDMSKGAAFITRRYALECGFYEYGG